MSKSGRPNYRRGDRERRHQEKLERRIYVRTVRRPEPDVALLGKAFLALALADAARIAGEATSHDTAATPRVANRRSNGQEVRDDD